MSKLNIADIEVSEYEMNLISRCVVYYAYGIMDSV